MELTTANNTSITRKELFMMSKIQNLNGTHNRIIIDKLPIKLFMMSKIQNLNGTHNELVVVIFATCVVYDVKDTKFEWNSQQPSRPNERAICCL